MAKKVISYKLDNGTVPTYVENGGYFAKDPNDTPNMVLCGVSVDTPTLPAGVTEYANEAALVAYLNTYTADWREVDPITREDIGPWSQADAAAWLFSQL